MTRRFRLLLVGIGLVLSALACRTGAEPFAPAPTFTPQPIRTMIPAIETPDVSLANDQTQYNGLTNLYEYANPGVVSVRVLTDLGNGLGSGFVYDTKGHIITNYHVIAEETDFEVDFPSGLKVRGEVVGVDPDSDLAVIKVDVAPEELHPLPLGDSDQVKVGQTVVAIGNPFGLNGSMTVGIVSAVGRTMESLHQAPGGSFFTAAGLIQTDAAINPGNSGGPLLNLEGEVIGINRAIQTTNFTEGGEPMNTGVGFAIPVNIIKRVVPALITEGKYDYPYMGVSCLGELSLLQQEALGLPQSDGAYVTFITPDSPAERTGLRGGDRSSSISGLDKGGDLIVAVDSIKVRVFNDLLSYLVNHKSPGDTITLTVLRDGQEIQLEMVLDKRP